MANIDWNQFAINSAKPSYSGRFYYELDTNQGKYWYVPQEFVNQGLRQGDTQFIEQSFLNKDYLNVLNPVRLDKSINIENLVNAGYKDPYSGFLIKDEDYKKYDVAPEWVTTYNAVGKFGGPIQGIGEKDGNLVYSFAGSGGSTYGVIDKSGTPTETTVTIKKSGGLLGDIFRAVGSVPFLPEIAGLATGNPYVYAALKGVQGGVAGEDPLKVGLKVGGTIFAANAIGGLSSSPGGGASELASVGETGYGLTGPISSTAPGVPSAFDQAVTGALSGTSPIAPSVQVGTQGFGSATLPSGASVVGASGSLLGGAPIETRNLADYPLAVETAYPAVPIEQTYSPAPGSFQEVLPGLGVETQASQAPFTAAPGSFAAATAPAATAAGYGLLSQPSSTISLQQALRGANLANQLLNPPEFPGMPMDGGQQPRLGGVDYSGLLGLLQARAGLPNVAGLLSPAQIRYPSSLLG